MYRRLYRLRKILRIAAARLRAHAARLAGARADPKCLLGARVRIERPWTVRLGARCVLEPEVWLNVVADDARLTLGDRVFVGRGSEIGVSRSVAIGRDALVGPGVFITDHNHGTTPGVPMNAQPCPAAPVVIGDDCWLGAKCVILPGVTVGDGAIVGAGAVVTRDVPPGAIVAGIPARVIGMRGPGLPHLPSGAPRAHESTPG